MMWLPEDELLAVGSKSYEAKRARIGRVFQALRELTELANTLDEIDEATALMMADMSQLWTVLLGEEFIQRSYAQVPDEREDLHWLTTQTLERVGGTAHRLKQRILSLEGLEDFPAHVRALAQEFRLASRRAKVLNALGEHALSQTNGIIDPLRSVFTPIQVEVTGQAFDETLQKRDLAQEIAEDMRQLSGPAAEGKVSKFYAQMAETEERSANTFRRLTILLSCIGGAAAFLFLLTPLIMQLAKLEQPTGADGYVWLAQKAIFVAGMFAIAGYFARQAHQHRSLANWANSLSVQLQTFAAYVDAVESPDVRDELRKAFAARAFGDHPAMKGDPPVPTQTGTMDAQSVMDFVAKVLPSSKS